MVHWLCKGRRTMLLSSRIHDAAVGSAIWADRRAEGSVGLSSEEKKKPAATHNSPPPRCGCCARLLGDEPQAPAAGGPAGSLRRCAHHALREDESVLHHIALHAGQPQRHGEHPPAQRVVLRRNHPHARWRLRLPRRGGGGGDAATRTGAGLEGGAGRDSGAQTAASRLGGNPPAAAASSCRRSEEALGSVASRRVTTATTTEGSPEAVFPVLGRARAVPRLRIIAKRRRPGVVAAPPPRRREGSERAAPV